MNLLFRPALCTIFLIANEINAKNSSTTQERRQLSSIKHIAKSGRAGPDGRERLIKSPKRMQTQARKRNVKAAVKVNPMTIARWDPNATSTLVDYGSGYALTGHRPGHLKYEPACCMDEGASMVGGIRCFKPVNDKGLTMFKAQNPSKVFVPIDDAPMQCGTGKIDMQLSKNMAVYLDFDSCLDFTRQIKNNYRLCASEMIPFHVYWSGPLHYQLLQVARSFLATQDLAQSEMWIWSTEPEPTTNPTWAGLQAIASKHLKWKKYDLATEIKGTVLDGRIDHVRKTDKSNWVDSDLFRILITHNYGGVYLDADVVLLRDFAPILGNEWLYSWGSSCNYANGAVASIHKGSDLAKKFLSRISQIRARPGSFDWGRNMYHSVWQEEKFGIMPVCLFDVYWMFDTTAYHAPYPITLNGPFALHIHALVWRDCIEKNEPLDLVSEWYTERIRQRFGSAQDFPLPRSGACKKAASKKWDG